MVGGEQAMLAKPSVRGYLRFWSSQQEPSLLLYSAMDLQLPLEQRAKVEEFQRKHRVALLTLVFTDLVGSTQLKQRLGDSKGVQLIQRYRSSVRQILRVFTDAEEIETAGDSFFLVFAKPSDAVRFSLLLQSNLSGVTAEIQELLPNRIGIHVGEVFVEEHHDAGKAKDLYGIQVDVCARVMSLAAADQILMTRSVFDNSRQILKGQDIEGVGALSWLNHGPYLLKGVEEPMEICEVGELNRAVLKPPSDSEKVHRFVSPDAEPVWGWRPAIGQGVPGTSWVLEEKLGEGGFGEVWLGQHKTTKQRRVFKFCFRADRVRSLKREMTLFRVMKERLGEHPHIVGVQDVYLEEAPYYLTMEYVAGRDLKTWSEERGGIGAIPLEVRLEIVAQVAEALQAAHDAGVIHRDVKPGNILIVKSGRRNAETGSPRSKIQSSKTELAQPLTLDLELNVKLTDFGIGQVISDEFLAGVTRAGFTETMVGSTASQLGTQVYMAPELSVGQSASPRSDIYSLGVVLYQLLVGDFSRPVTTDWAKEIADPLLREDLEHCFAGNPDNRFSGAIQLAKQLRGLPERRREWERKQAETAARERAAYRRGVKRAAWVAAAILMVVGGLALFAWGQFRITRHVLYSANMNLAQRAWEENNVGLLKRLLEETETYPDRGFEWYYWQRLTHLDARTLRHGYPLLIARFTPDGKRIVTAAYDKVVVWEAASGRELFTIKGHSTGRGSIAGIQSFALSLNGKWIVTGSWDSTAKVWDATNGRALLTLKGHRGQVTSVAISQDGRTIVTGSVDDTAKIWEAASGRELFTLEGHPESVSFVAFASDQKVVTHSATMTKVWDAASGRELRTLESDTNSMNVRRVALSPDGQRIVMAGSDGAAKVWDTSTGKELLTLKDQSGKIRSIAFSPDGKWIVSGGTDGLAKLWETLNGQELLTLNGHGGAVESVAFSMDGSRLITGNRDRTATVWDVASGREMLTLKGHSHQITSLAFSPDGARVVTGSDDHTAKVWGVPELPERERLGDPITLKGVTNSIRSVAFSRDGQRIVTANINLTATVWDAATGRDLVILHAQSGVAPPVTISLDGQRIVTGTRDKDNGKVGMTAKVWDASSGRELITLKGHSDEVTTAAFSPDGRRILTGSKDMTAKVWEAANGRELFTLKGHKHEIYSVAFSRDGQRVFTGDENGAMLMQWDAASGRKLRTLRWKDYWIRSVAFSSNNHPIVLTGTYMIGDSASQPAIIKVRDADSGRELLTLDDYYRDQIISYDFYSDGGRLVTGSRDKIANVWKTASGRAVLTLKGHGGEVSPVVFSPDGQRILTVSSDGIAKVWEAASREQAAGWKDEEKEAAKRFAAEGATRRERLKDFLTEFFRR